MSYPAVSTDKSRRIDFHSRCGEPGDVVTFVFTDSDGDPVDISGENWSLVVKRKPSSPTDLFELTEGDGLTVTGDDDNNLEVYLPEEEADQDPGVFFAKLISNTEGKTRFNGHWQFHDGLFDGVPPVTPFVVNWSGTIINVTVQWGGGGTSSGTPQKQGIWSSNAFPTTSGILETGGPIKDAYYWLIADGGVTINGLPLGGGTIIWANQDDPADDFTVTGWKYF
jgi:hypothetical protein